MGRTVNFFGLLSVNAGILLLAALCILSIPDLIRYRIRPFIDEWTMDLTGKVKKRKRGRRAV